jgi:hypothetical protein
VRIKEFKQQKKYFQNFSSYLRKASLLRAGLIFL